MDKSALKRVLILEENTDHLELLTNLLEEQFTPIDIHTVETIEDCLDFLEQTDYDIVITGSFIHSVCITERLVDIVERAKGAPVIIVSGKGDENMAAEVIKLGASEFLIKSRKNLEKLSQVVAKYFKRSTKNRTTVHHTPEGAEVTSRLIRELDHLMQKARNVTSDIAFRGTSKEDSSLDALFTQIQRLRKIISDQK